MEFELFGYKIGKKLGGEPQQLPKSFSTHINDDGAAEKILGNNLGGFTGTSFDISENISKVEDLVSTYRGISRHPILDMAIKEIVNEAIVNDSSEDIITVILDDTKFSKSIRNKIVDEWKYIYSNLLDLDRNASDLFQQWYIEGVLQAHKIIDEGSPKKGILQINVLDATKIKKIREITKEKTGEIEYVKDIKEYYVFHNEGLKGKQSVLKINPELIAMVNSGLVDPKTGANISFLDKAIRPLNMLKYAEDAQLIYRISRAPERRVFYIDIGMMNGSKAEQYIRNMMDKFRNKLIYDSNTGEMKSTRNYQAFTEDYWLPRREGGKGTEVTTLPGGTNLSQIEDILYFKQALYQSLNVPVQRIESENVFSMGRTSEITREEVKFAKFIMNLRNRFSEFLYDILRTQLLLKGIITSSDWKSERSNIIFRFNRDSYYDDIKKLEAMKDKLDILSQVDSYVGKYFTEEYVFKEILEMSDEEIDKTRKTISEEGYDEDEFDGDDSSESSTKNEDKSSEKSKELNKSKEDNDGE